MSTRKSSDHANESLNRAKANKNSEFYTSIVDIEREILESGCYDGCFSGKIVLCNCNDAVKGGFNRFFTGAFGLLGLRKLIVTSYGENAKVSVYDGVCTKYYSLTGNGDFLSEEGIEILKHADIVVTNPPFSLFRAFIAQVIEYNKQFIIIANANDITCKNIFPLVMEGRMWFGHNSIRNFDTPDGERPFGYTRWLTNVGAEKQFEPITLTSRYHGNEDKYPKYDNFDAIDVKNAKDIPYDYEGMMGVPITFLEKCNPEQFELLGEANHGQDNKYDRFVPIVNGRDVGRRLVIRNLHVIDLNVDKVEYTSKAK